MNSTRKLLLVVAFAFAGVAAFASWGWRASQGVPKMSLSFIGYTNDTWVRLCYRIPNVGEHSTALFRLDNKTKEELFYSHSRIQAHTQTGWTDDPNWDAPAVSKSRVLSPGQSAEIYFPVPSGIRNW